MGPSGDLPWLIDAPGDLRAQARNFDFTRPDAGLALQRLANCRYDAGGAMAVARLVARGLAAGCDLAPMTRFRLAILSNATTDLLADELVAAAARNGVALETVIAPFDQMEQEALDPASKTNGAKPDAVLLALDHHWFGLGSFAPGSSAAAQVAAACARLDQVVDAIRANSGAPCILQTLAVPPESLFGSYDRQVAGSPRAMLEALNSHVLRRAGQSSGYVLDVAAVAERLGTARWFDPARWHLYKLPFAGDCTAHYAEQLARLLGAIRGKAKKCLVLDLDNTVWGGVVGDDGVEGLKIGQGNARGEAFLAVQRYALDLWARGIFLAVSSKNNDETARAPFRSHPDMLLREHHIAVFQANWLDKASNLEAIARQLNIGVDALVLLDDNGAERAQVRAALPMVGVPELPADPALYVRTLAAAGYFEAVAFSREDELRAASQGAEAQRAEVLHKARDLGDYLASLGMQIAFEPFSPLARSRIAQLVNKSNQFNLTTRRYSEAEIAALEHAPAVFTLQARLADKFGDFGMIGVVIARPTGQEAAAAWEIDSWLMSCRVLGRRVEEAMLAEMVRQAQAQGITHLTGIYRPTAKNNMVAQHYDKLGFAVAHEASEGVKHYRLELDGYAPALLPMQVTRL